MGLSNDKVGEKWAPVRRCDIHESPKADLSRSFVEEEDIFDEGDRDRLTRCKEEALNGSDAHEHFKIGGNG